MCTGREQAPQRPTNCYKAFNLIKSKHAEKHVSWNARSELLKLQAFQEGQYEWNG